jgi:hypothetical protein
MQQVVLGHHHRIILDHPSLSHGDNPGSSTLEDYPEISWEDYILYLVDMEARDAHSDNGMIPPFLGGSSGGSVQ